MFRRIVGVLTGRPTCRRVSNFLMDYVEGRLHAKTASRFEEHISACPNCATYLEQYKETIRMVKEVPPPEIPPELADRTSRFLQEHLGSNGAT